MKIRGGVCIFQANRVWVYIQIILNSEISTVTEVAQYKNSNANTILVRDLKLLQFMERRWRIKFPFKSGGEPY